MFVVLGEKSLDLTYEIQAFTDAGISLNYTALNFSHGFW